MTSEGMTSSQKDCICYDEYSDGIFTYLKDGCTGVMEEGGVIVKGWANADTPQPLHMRCTKSLWSLRRYAIAPS